MIFIDLFKVASLGPFHGMEGIAGFITKQHTVGKPGTRWTIDISEDAGTGRLDVAKFKGSTKELGGGLHSKRMYYKYEGIVNEMEL